jgi:hypothetical protein
MVLEDVERELSKVYAIKKESMQSRYPDWYNDFKEWLILD